METLREFLESSTIHGLSYISTSQVILASLHTLSYPDQTRQGSVEPCGPLWFPWCNIPHQ